MHQRNYLDVYPYDKWDGSYVPDFRVGEKFMPSVCELREGQTTRPNLLTEADLVNLMDKNGIGESTHLWCEQGSLNRQALMLLSLSTFQ